MHILKIKNKLTSIPRRIYLLVSIVGLIVTGLVGYGFYTGYQMNTIYAPLIDAAMEIKLEATAAHLWFEEVLSGDTKVEDQNVWQHSKQAVWYLRAMLVGGKNFEGTFAPVTDTKLRQQLKDVQSKLDKLEVITLQRLTTENTTGPHSEQDQEYDNLFRALIDQVDQIETRLQQLMSQSLDRFQVTQAILIVTCILLVICTAISFQRFEHQRTEYFNSLQKANESLEKEIIEREKAEDALKNAHDKLEHRVQSRTLELAQTNEQLTHEIEERRRTEQELLRYQARLRRLSSEMSLTEERDRRRIATELHDRISQPLAFTTIKLGELQEASPSNNATKVVDEIRQFIGQTIEDTRSLTFELSPPVLYDLGLEAAVEGLTNKIQKQSGLKIEFYDDEQPKHLSEGVRVFVYQAILELLLNITQHAKAARAKVSIQREGENIVIDVRDDGVGFDTAKIISNIDNTYELGLFNIRERLNYFRGALKIISESGSGTHVTMVLPLSYILETEGK